MEFRTQPPGSDREDGGSGSGKIEEMVNTYIKNARNDRNLQLQLLQLAQDNGIEPTLVAPLLDIDSQKIQQAQERMQAQQQQQQQTQDEPMTIESEETEKLTSEQLAEFIEELMDYTGEQTSIAKVKEFVEENPDVTQTAIDMHF